MAKNDDNMLDREKGGSRIVTVLIALAIIAIWLVIFACLIKFDVGGIGSNVLYPVLKDVPVVNRILPTPSEEEQAKVFARFYRSPAVADQEGVGIGLYLTRQILASQGGYIKVASKLGQGSVFSVFLQRAA